MTYRVTLASASPVHVLRGALAACLLGGGLFVYPNSAVAICAELCVLAWVVAVRMRCFVEVSNDSLEVGTLVRTVRVYLHEITSVCRKADTSFLASRLFGPHVYEFRTTRTQFRINFTLYPPACAGEVLDMVRQGLIDEQNCAV